MMTTTAVSPSAARPHSPLDCLRNRPDILEAIGEGISHAGYVGSRSASNTYVPSNGPGLVTYVELNGQVGTALTTFGVRKFEANGINNLVLAQTAEYPEVRLVFSQGLVCGERALLNEKGPYAMDLVKNNRRYLGLGRPSTGALRLLDREDDAQMELDFPTFLSVWVIWKRYMDRMEAWLIVPIDADDERKRLEFYDMEALGAFPHAELPEQVVQRAMQSARPEAAAAVFNIEERPDSANGTSG